MHRFHILTLKHKGADTVPKRRAQIQGYVWVYRRLSSKEGGATLRAYTAHHSAERVSDNTDG